MNLSFITKTVASVTTVVAKHAPDILTYAGVAGFVGTAVLASKATLTVNEVLEPSLEDLEKIQLASTDERFEDKYRGDVVVRDRIIVYTRIVKDLAKHYAPAIILGVGSAIAIFSANSINKKRIAAVVAAYEILDSSFKSYKKRVERVFGEEGKKKLSEALDFDDIEGPDAEKITDFFPEIKKNVSEVSRYARVFDQENMNWGINRVQNETFLAAHQNYFNDLLKVRGHVLLNDVYDALGMDRTTAGAVVGWTNDGTGDGYIDFHYLENAKDTVVNTREHGEITARVYLLDFNVDGLVYDKIGD